MSVGKADEFEPAAEGVIRALFGLLPLQGVSLAACAAPKIAPISAPLRSQNFKVRDFWLCAAQNAGNPVGFPSILTKQNRKSRL